MKTYASLCVLGTLVAASCLEKFELPEVTDTAGMQGGDAGAVTPPCGGSGEVCCTERQPACGDRLRCDADSLTCVPEEARLCVSGEQCHPGQTCCPSGLVGSCLTLAPGSVCPTPDLAILTTQETLALWTEERTFDAASPEAACAIEKRCVGGPGPRRLLHFSMQVKNQGSADLVLGDPSRTPGFVASAACDEQPYFPDYMRYELVDIGGVVLPGASTRMPARCHPLPQGFSSRFSCELWGLWRDFSETYSDQDDCQWVDITDVPAGDYVLRVTLNPDSTIEEPGSGNRQDYQVTLPSFGDPLQNCASAPDPTGGRGLLDEPSGARGCGWRLSTTAGASCTPGERVLLGCPSCTLESDQAIGPALSVCEGASPCSSGQVLISDLGTWRFSCDNEVDEGISSDECFRRADEAQASGSCLLSSCELVGNCPTVRFTCPPSGLYTALGAAIPWDAPFSCEAVPLSEVP